MRLIIAGPRDLHPSRDEVGRAVAASGFEPRMEVSGGYDGVDIAGEQWARLHAEIPFVVIPAKWTKSGKRAGPARNEKLAEYGDGLLVIKRPGKETSGTSDMMSKAKATCIPVYVHEVATAEAGRSPR